MCHRRSFLASVVSIASLTLAAPWAAADSISKPAKKTKMIWYARVYKHARMSLIGKFKSKEDAIKAGHKWLDKAGKGATYFGETMVFPAK
ncbi:MAG: hypothetical protein AB7O62_13850 [Pirellulales bacterium]